MLQEKFWGDKQRALWHVMVFSAMVNLITCKFEFYSLRPRDARLTETIYANEDEKFVSHLIHNSVKR